MTRPDHDPHARFWSQYRVAEATLAARGIKLDHRLSQGGSRARAGIPDEIFEKDRLLVPTQSVALINAHATTTPVPDRGVRYRSAGNEEKDLQLLQYTEDRRVPEMIKYLEDSGVPPGTATPNHLVSICGVCLCPAAEPVLPGNADPDPAQAPDNEGDGIRVTVVDTGLWKGYAAGHPWLDDLDGDLVDDITGTYRVPLAPGAMPPIPEYYGHGVFIAGVLRCVAPGVHVRVSNALQWAGAMMEDEFGHALLDALGTGADQPHIISLSAGSRTLGKLPHRGLEPFLDELNKEDCTTLLVAAAGNDGEDREFFPAALARTMPDSVLSVGALREDGLGRACFSNFGEWVDVFATGERIVNAFPTGRYTYIDPPAVSPLGTGHSACWYYEPSKYDGCTCDTAPAQGSVTPFAGMAEWSGTSFSTPYVAGLIARHMTKNGITNARIAKNAVLAVAKPITDATDGVTKINKLS